LIILLLLAAAAVQEIEGAVLEQVVLEPQQHLRLLQALPLL
tara:strand:- start:673 stop:795 length:123 start_codon:yes stop_codon:yes gene_type:complete